MLSIFVGRTFDETHHMHRGMLAIHICIYTYERLALRYLGVVWKACNVKCILCYVNWLLQYNTVSIPISLPHTFRNRFSDEPQQLYVKKIWMLIGY